MLSSPQNLLNSSQSPSHRVWLSIFLKYCSYSSFLCCSSSLVLTICILLVTDRIIKQLSAWFHKKQAFPLHPNFPRLLDHPAQMRSWVVPFIFSKFTSSVYRQSHSLSLKSDIKPLALHAINFIFPFWLIFHYSSSEYLKCS